MSAAMTGFTSLAPPCNSNMVRNASNTLNNKMPIATASRWDECQSSEWKRESSWRRGGARLRGLKLPYQTDHHTRWRRSARARRSREKWGPRRLIRFIDHTIPAGIGARQAQCVITPPGGQLFFFWVFVTSYG